MIAVLGISLALMMPGLPAIHMPLPMPVQGDVLDTIIPSFVCKDEDARAVLKRLFGGVHQKYWVSPEVELMGTITLKLDNTKFELVLQHVLNQVGFTYRYDKGAFLILDRGDNYGDPGPPEDLREFSPRDSTSRFVIKNSGLFMAPRRTVGGTFNLMTEAMEAAGFESWSEWSYGSFGFAIVLPIEAIDQTGVPLRDRFSLDISYLPKFNFSKLAELFATGYNNLDRDYRMIVLSAKNDLNVTGGQPKRDKLWRYPGVKGLPYEFRLSKWKKEPEVTAYVYEFRRQNGSHLANLLKPGQSKISARQHLVLAGLWTEKELGNKIQPKPRKQSHLLKR